MVRDEKGADGSPEDLVEALSREEACSEPIMSEDLSCLSSRRGATVEPSPSTGTSRASVLPVRLRAR